MKELVEMKRFAKLGVDAKINQNSYKSASRKSSLAAIPKERPNYSRNEKIGGRKYLHEYNSMKQL